MLYVFTFANFKYYLLCFLILFIKDQNKET